MTSSGGETTRRARGRSGWEVLDRARASGFTGELEFALDPPAHVFLEAGAVYLAECDRDPPIGARLIAAGVLTEEQLDAGAVAVAGELHLGRVLELVPSIDRAATLAALEMLSGETLAWIAAQNTPDVVSRPYVYHPSGVNRWYLVTSPAPPQLPAPLAPPRPAGQRVRGWRPSRRALAPSTDELRIEWLEDVLGATPGATDAGPAPLPSVPQSPPEEDFVADASMGDTVPESDRAPAAAPRPAQAGEDVLGEALAADASLEVLVDRFELMWPSGEIGVTVPWSDEKQNEEPPESSNDEGDRGARAVEEVNADAGLDVDEDPDSSSLAETHDRVPSAPAPSRAPGSQLPPRYGAPAPSEPATDQLRLAVRQTVSAIEEGFVRGLRLDPVVPVSDEEIDPFDRWSDVEIREHAGVVGGGWSEPVSADPFAFDEDPFAGWTGPETVADVDPFDEAAPDLSVGEEPTDVESHTTVETDRTSVRRGTVAPRSKVPGFGAPDPGAERRTALRRLIDDLRGR